MILMFDDVTPEEWGGNPLEKPQDVFIVSENQLDENFDLIEARAIIRQLRKACSRALELRGIWIAINDPLALEGEKQILRDRYQQIEAEIRAAETVALIFRQK